MNATQTITGNCPKCLGSGTVPFRHIEGGRCFMCGGTGKVSGKIRHTKPTPAAPVEKLTANEALDRIKTIVEQMKEKDGWKSFHGTDAELYLVGPALASILSAINAAQ